MASITTYGSIYLLSNVPDFEVTGLTSGEVCNVKITQGETSIFDEDLTANSIGKITITDIPSLLEEYFDSYIYRTFTFTATLADEAILSVKVNVVYGNVECSDFKDFLSQHFLHPYTKKRTDETRRELLTLLIASSETVSITVRAYYTDGTYKDYEIEGAKDSVNSTDDASFYEIDVRASQFVETGKTLYRYVVQCGERTMDYVIDPDHADADTAFMYRNCFGAWDVLYCNGKTETEDTFEREGTYIDGVYKNYKITEVKNLNCDTGILLPFETSMAQDILRSKSVYLCKIVNGEYSKWKEIAIMDNDTTHSEEPDDLPRYTFICRLAQRRQNILDWHLFPEIFTEQYTETYE